MTTSSPDPSLSDVTEPASLRHWVRIALVVGLIALVVRVIFIWSLSAAQPEPGSYDNAGDARQYIALARNFAERGTFIDDSPTARPAGRTYFSLLRPPLYPLFVAPFEAFEYRTALFFVQGVVGAGLPMLATLLAGFWFGSRVGAWLAGLCAAFSPVAIGLSGQVMADLPFAIAYAASIAALAVAARSTRKAMWLCLAGLACAAGTLIKPAGLYWVFVLPIVALILCWGERSRFPWRAVVVAMLIAIALPMTWAMRNWHVGRVFRVSSVDAQNLRYYLAPMAEEWARADGVPGKGHLRRNRQRAMRRDEADRDRLPVREIVQRQWAESMAIFKTHPRETWVAYWHNVRGHLTTPFNGFDYQFPTGGRMREAMRTLEDITGSPFAYGIILFFSAAALLPLAVPRSRRDPTWRRRIAGTTASVIVIGYIAGLSGTTFGTGARILFPAHLGVYLLMASGVAFLTIDVPRLFARRRANDA